MKSYKKSAIAILVNSKKQILLHLRDDKPEIQAPNHWAFIGGGVEDGESELDCIMREIKEEIKRFIDNLQYLEEFYLKEYDLMVFVYVGKIDAREEEIELTEGQCVKFFDPSEIRNLKMPKLLKDVVYRNLDKIMGVADSSSQQYF